MVLELGLGDVGVMVVVVVRARVNRGMWWRWVWEIVLELRVEVGGTPTPDHHLLPPPLENPSTVSPHSKLHIVIQCHGPPLPVSM